MIFNIPYLKWLSVFGVIAYNFDIGWVVDSLLEFISARENGTAETVYWPEKKLDSMLDFLWQLLVLEFGNYGTSPRFGWIEDENINALKELLTWAKKEYEVV